MNCNTTPNNKKFLSSIYHEKQRSAFCATHAFNNLFQSNLFSEFDFAAIAEQLDKKEQELFSSEEDFAKVRGNNVDPHGNFSIQVLSSALEGQGVTITHLMKPEVRAYREHPESAQAFLCNHASHWLTLRKFGSKHWMNLDSTLKEPQFISPTFLGLFIEQLIQEGYSVFALQGSFPGCEADQLASIFDSSQCIPVKKEENTADLDPDMQIALSLSQQDQGGSGQQSEEEMLQRALRISLQESSREPQDNDIVVDDDELTRAISLSLQSNQSSTTAQENNSTHEKNCEDEDEDLKLAIAMSMSQP